MKIFNLLNIKKNDQYNHFIPSEKQQFDWTVELSANPNVRNFSPEIIAKYFVMHDFTRCDLDSYSLSPAYYTMTGRKGAWVYEKNDTAIVICDHPNVEGKALIFPEIGKGGILPDLIEEMPSPPNGFQLARVPAAKTRNTQEELDSKYPNMKFIEVPEYAQDWLYPAQIFCTRSVANLNGGSFGRARGRYNHFRKNNEVCVKNLSNGVFCNNKKEIQAFIQRWSDNFKGTSDELSAWLHPLYFMLSVLEKGQCSLDATIIYCNGKIEAINIYEKPAVQNLPANLLFPFYNTSIKGLSEYSIIDLCSRLHDEGIHKLDIGGSETEGLDRYKRKFNPVESKELSTIEVIKE